MGSRPNSQETLAASGEGTGTDTRVIPVGFTAQTAEEFDAERRNARSEKPTPELEIDDALGALINRINDHYGVTLNNEAILLLKTVHDEDPSQNDGTIFWRARLLAGQKHDVKALSSLDPEIQSAISALRLLYSRHNNRNN